MYGSYGYLEHYKTNGLKVPKFLDSLPATHTILMVSYNNALHLWVTLVSYMSNYFLQSIKLLHLTILFYLRINNGLK